MKRMKHPLARGCASAALLAMSGFASAQISPPPAGIAQQNDQNAKSSVDGNTASPATPGAPQSSNEELQEIIVTATPSAGGLKKLDAAFSEVSLSQEQIKEAGLTASADILRSSPGVYIESSGGPGGGANIEVAGFPSNSGAPYSTFELNGASLFPMAGQVFLDGDVLLRPDDTVQRVELVQGGPAVLYGDGQPGLTANYILKQGADTPTGDLAFTYGFEHSERVDGFYGGPINSDAGLYGSLGGYWITSDGVRNPQFTADQGGQLTGTLSKDWTNGRLMVYGRYINFDDEFVTDTPIISEGNGKWAPYPGFSPLTGTMSSKANQYLNLPVAPCTGTGCAPVDIPLNQANGRGVLANTFGGELNWGFGHDVQVFDNFNITHGVAHMTALYSSPVNPESLQAFINANESADKLKGITGINAYYTDNGASVPLNQSVLEAETRYLLQHFHSESNEIHLSWEMFPGNTLTVGNRAVWYGINELYYTGADILLQAKSNPAPIGIDLTNGVNTWQLTNSQGLVNGPTGTNLDNGSGVNTAFFLSDSWKYENWLLDAGVREERQNFHETAENGASGSLTGNPYQLWAKGKYLTSGSTSYPYDRTAASWTVGLNYEINTSMSAYVRANKGVHFLAFSDVTGLPPGNDGSIETAFNYQAGYKYKNRFIYADVSAFYRTFANVPVAITGIPIPGTTTTGTGTIVYGSSTKGIEYQLTLSPFTGIRYWAGLTLSASGDTAWGRYTQANGCIYYTGAVTELYCVASDNIKGYLLARQPTFQTRVTPAYELATTRGYLKFWANFEYVGKHYSDMLEDDYLGTYYDLSAGISATVGQHWEWTLSGTNLTNKIGLTEENPRVSFGSGVPAPGPQLARSIDGREVSLQLKFKF
jgi:outer membrane receptor protein involved in Fe transport